jgi:hypothetical protein
VADLQAQVPQQLHQALQLGLGDGVRRGAEQDQQVDVGVGKQFAAAVAADADQRRVGGRRAATRRRQDVVDAVAQAAQQLFRLAVLAEGGEQGLALGLQACFSSGCGLLVEEAADMSMNGERLGRDGVFSA